MNNRVVMIGYTHKITRKIKIRNKRKFKTFYKLYWGFKRESIGSHLHCNLKEVK